MPNFDPGQALPDDLEPTVISQPVAPTASGGGYIGRPTVADPAQEAAAAFAASNAARLAQAAYNRSHAGMLGTPSLADQAPPAPVVAPAPPVVPLPAPAPATPPEVPQDVASPALPASAPVGGGGVGGGGGEMGEAIGEVKASGQESTQVGRDATKLAEERAATDAQADKLRADEAQASADRLRGLQATQKKAYDESVARFDQARADVANHKFEDFFARAGTARTVLAAVSQLLGGASYDANHVNQVNGIIQSALNRDAQEQLQFLHSKEHLAELAQQGVRDTQTYLAHEMADFHTAEALKKEAVAAEIDRLSSTVRGKQNVNIAQATAAKLREQAAKDQQAAIIQGTHNRVMQSEIALNRARAANEGVGRAQKVQTAAEQAAEKVVTARLKANKPVETLLKEREELQKANDASVPDSKTGRVNGPAFQSAVDGFTKAITGLGARKSQIDITTGSFGGLVDKIKRNVQKGIDGEYTAHDVQVFRQGLEKIQRANGTALQVARKLDEQAFARHPLTKSQKDIYQSALDQRYGAAAETPAASDPNAEARAWATSHPSDPRAAQILARIGG